MTSAYSLALFDCRAGLLQRQETALDTPGIEEDGEALVLRIPEFLLQLQERQLDELAGSVIEMDAPPRFSSLHGGRKSDVKLQLIAGENISGG